jgi:hypothetical protein
MIRQPTMRIHIKTCLTVEFNPLPRFPKPGTPTTHGPYCVPQKTSRSSIRRHGTPVWVQFHERQNGTIKKVLQHLFYSRGHNF